MRALVIGGTRFLGRYLVDELLASNHYVTLFNRGVTQPDAYPSVEKIQGDRHSDIDLLAAREWDVIFDTCGYFPAVVARNADVLEHLADCYVFVSSISVYADLSLPRLNELSDTVELSKNADPDMDDPTTYGARKAPCELAVEVGFPQKHLFVRPGILTGPGDYSGRFCYWLQRIAQGGEVLAADHKDRPLQFIDVRDLAMWMVRMVEQGEYGVYNTVGPETSYTMGQFLADCQLILGSECAVTWVDEEFLVDQGVEPWQGLPLWIPESLGGLMEISSTKARDKGLSFRPVSSTIRDTWTWMQEEQEPLFEQAGNWIAPNKEQEVLAAWKKFQEKG